MKGYCGICKKVIDETEANPWKGKHICDSCLDEELNTLPKYTIPSDKERQEVDDLFGGSME